MKVIIGAPTRNRGWIIQSHLDSLRAMHIPEGVEVVYFYLVNDSTDHTAAVLEANGIYYATHNTGHSSGSVRGQYSYQNLAMLRNTFIHMALAAHPDATHLLSIDSDIIVPFNALAQLLEDDKDIISMLLCNEALPIEMQRAHNVMNEDIHSIMRHIFDFPMDAIFPCDLTGACYLIKRAVLDAGCMYADDVQGEDIPFCRQAKARGFGIFCDSRIRPIHAMYEGQEIAAGRLISEG